ncbi:MAG TPA: amidase domain-containing protein [Thermoleophilia bacterium]|nr:amidase domain-containing protein [Thermoleophilia bacterium]
MSRDVGRRRIYRSRAVRRRRSALAVAVAAALALIVLVGAQGAKPKPVRVTFDRRAAAGYADTWALGDNPEYWSSPDRDCANFVSQCLAAGGLRPTYDDGHEWRADGTAFPTIAWVNCAAQLRALISRSAAHTRYIVAVTRAQPRDWAAGDIVYLGNVVDGKLEWQHVIICAGRQEGEWVYDSHTAARRHGTLAHWYPAHFSAVRFCRIADSVVYTQQ